MQKSKDEAAKVDDKTEENKKRQSTNRRWCEKIGNQKLVTRDGKTGRGDTGTQARKRNVSDELTKRERDEDEDLNTHGVIN